MANLEGGESMHFQLSPGDAERRPIPSACSLESTGARIRRQDADDAKMTAADEKTGQRAKMRAARLERRGELRPALGASLFRQRCGMRNHRGLAVQLAVFVDELPHGRAFDPETAARLRNAYAAIAGDEAVARHLVEKRLTFAAFRRFGGKA